MSAGQSNWKPGPADDWANRQMIEGREVLWAAIGGPRVNALGAASPRQSDYARAIWNASRADEGTISATGANIVARAAMKVADAELADLRAQVARLERRGVI